MDLETLIARADALRTDTFHMVLERGQPVPEAVVAAAEKRLNVTFPDDLKRFFSEVGSLTLTIARDGEPTISGTVLGLQQDPTRDIDTHLERFREEYGDPGAIMDDREEAESDAEASLMDELGLIPLIVEGPYEFKITSCMGRDGHIYIIGDSVLEDYHVTFEEELVRRLEGDIEFWESQER